MGFLDFETVETHTYQESKPLQKKSKKLAVRQFIKLYKKFAGMKVETDAQHKYPKYGFELEVHALIKQEQETGPNYVLESSLEYLRKNKKLGFDLNHEYGAWMAEMVPKSPFSSYTCGSKLLLQIRLCFKQIYQAGRENSEFLSTVMYPKMGTKYMLKDLGKADWKRINIMEANPYSNSQFVCDSIINSHPRYRTFTLNVRLRRQENPMILAPLYVDKNTIIDKSDDDDPYPGYVYLDSRLFGMGMNCLQVTFSAKTIDEGRWCYDQMHMFTPIFMALSASTPIQKGKLLNTDTRWEMLSSAVDDRNPRERRVGGIEKSRYSAINYFIANDPRNLKAYNDKKYTINIKMKRYFKKMLAAEGLAIDNRLLNHLCYHLVRDNICIFKDDKIEKEEATNHFEAFQSSNWNDVRFKPPPSLESTIGWRVEFRSIDAQLTPEQNFLFSHACLVLFRVLTCAKTNCNFYIPMSKVDENFRRANMLDAAVTQRFYVRTNVFESGPAKVEELTIREIFEGTESFVGLQNIVRMFVKNNMAKMVDEQKDFKVNPVDQIEATYDYLRAVSAGEIPTGARLIRDFIQKHPSYQKDSVVPEDVLNELTTYLLAVQNKKVDDLNANLAQFIKC